MLFFEIMDKFCNVRIIKDCVFQHYRFSFFLWDIYICINIFPKRVRKRHISILSSHFRKNTVLKHNIYLLHFLYSFLNKGTILIKMLIINIQNILIYDLSHSVEYYAHILYNVFVTKSKGYKKHAIY